ncbi:MAG: 5'-nucleotidase, lipoprotein e(P4) family [Treponema sp.]|jgi:5'-nucleotidase (lipoprotein e(P4) family)|nr:5'-nucleotidase, lipoprotein e(P4) family [Treponema sp.]
MYTKPLVRSWLLGNLVIALLCSACVSPGPKVRQEKEAAAPYNHDLVMGILWQQHSGEYAALCYQAFNAGKAYIASLPLGEKPAVVFDIDETLLDNSKYAAWMVCTGNPWGNDTWEAWCHAREADAVPGSRDFALFLREQGIELFYISNRPASTTASTIENLQSLGFPLADADHVFLQESTSDKNPRLDRIRALGYDILLLAGDSLEDFDSTTRKWTNQERRAWADAKKDGFGAYRIVLPNAVYGTFESAIVPNYYGLSLEEKARARLEKIHSWKPSAAQD